MEESRQDETLGFFSKKRYVVPFGRYVGSTEVEPPADEVLVGREGQRAYLIDLLISTGRRGAYLVTGRRGTGKTSFVKHCIAEYEESVFSRFLRGNVGRGVWDRALVLLFWVALLFGALIVSELLQLLTQRGGQNVLPWMVFAPAGILLLYPCVYAKLVFETIVRSLRRPPPQQGLDSETSYVGLAAAGITVILTSLAWVVPGLQKPSAISLLFPLLGGCYLFAQAQSFQTTTTERKIREQLALHIGLLLYLTLILLVAYEPIDQGDPPGDAFRQNAGLGLALLGVGYTLRGTYQSSRAEVVVKHSQDERLGGAISKAMSTGAWWYAGTGSLATAIGVAALFFKPKESGLLISLLVFTVALVAIFIGYWLKQLDAADEAPRFRPRPAWILSLKALFSIIIAVQLSYPILAILPLELCFWEGDSLCKSAGATPTPPIFSGRVQELYWLLSLLILILVIHLLEYEWIIRPHLRTREDRSFDPGGRAPWDDWEATILESHEQRRGYRDLAVLTMPWVVYRNWLPVLPVSVNLGFDRLDHRQVVQAMLVGLRERYHRIFLAWNSGFANLGRFLGLLVLMMLVTLVSGSRLGSIWEDLRNDKWFRFLYADLVPELQGPGDLLIFEILPHSSPDPTFTIIHFRVYHLLLLLTFFFFGRWLLSKAPLLPYKENLRRIDDLLDNLSARTRITSGLNMWGPARWVYSIFADERVRETERDPVDPRTVELAFLQILEDVQKGGFRFPGAAKMHLTMPAPEITFVFDELDKLGTRVDPDLARTQEQETEILHQERERSIKLRALLSDFKNILASAPARFVFVGGRDLHDEWLADLTSRQPLLTSIFQTEVYLPSLLTDHGKRPAAQERRLHRRAEEYLLFQHKRAQILHCRSARKRWRPSFGLAVETLAHERFVPSEDARYQRPVLKDIQVIHCSTGALLGSGEDLLNDFILFLTHRSMGNPKKLKDLLASFIRPTGREVEDRIRWANSPCRHVLRLSDTEIFRFQLIASIYRHIALLFEDRMVERDDKFAISIFYLTDFLFKFHRRAFSWGNLERVDDLAHIHRLPDLRDLQEEIVNHFSERFLHRVLNGMYAYRFRSDIANEIEYLSRKSAAEMAALNFTLDESQSLKADYEASLKGWEEKNPDLRAALGELYEFDQDFEQARYSYRRAIEILDNDLKNLTAQVDKQSGEFRPGAPIPEILAGEDIGLKNARLFLAWGSARLRLMLQIGMTFEHARTFEQAEAEYRNARTLARALIRAYVDEEGRGEKQASRSASHASRLHSLKHLNILFQPLFAEAWLSEKFNGAIDSSISLVERGLWDLRSALPFTRKRKAKEVRDPVRTQHANFALTLSQLHNKAGDVYFFKGRQPVSADRVGRILEKTSGPRDRQTDGYLLRAHYHYAVGLHEIRRYVWQRVQSSPYRLSISSQKAPTLVPEALPDTLFRAAAGGVNDMAEATLARVSLFGLFQSLTHLKQERLDMLIQRDLACDCEAWFSSNDSQTADSPLANWFGVWNDSSIFDRSNVQLIDFIGPDAAEEQLLMSLKLCLVGAGHFEKGGYPEDAGRELLQVCETVTRYFWWRHAIDAIQRWTRIPGLGMSGIFKGVERTDAKGFWTYLLELAIYTLEKADALFRESRQREYGELYVVGRLIPAEALTLLCSLGISGHYLLDSDRRSRLAYLLEQWTGSNRNDFWEVLYEALQRHIYPMINRLHGMKVLIDTLVLSDSLSAKSQKGLWQDLVRTENLRPSPKTEPWQALEWTSELLDLSAQYDAPLHFTPLHSGTTCALLWLRWVSELPLAKDQVERIYRAAQRDLHNSEEMYTMRRAYYEAINDLYYLYDDFNDRQIHFNHAIQMAGSELTATLKRLIDLRGEVKEPLSRVS